MLKGLAAAAAGGLPAYLIGNNLSGLPALGAGAATLGLVYLAVIVALGITDEDRLVFSALRRRLRAANGEPTP
jgi:hypothetical protein